MKLEFEVTDLMSKEDIEGHAKDILIEILRKKISAEADRLLGNASWYCAHQIMDSLITEEQKTLIQQKTLKIIDGLSSHDVFRMKDFYGRDHSVAFYEMEQAVRVNRDRIIDKTVTVLETFDFEARLESDCMDILKDSILKKLSEKKKD